MADRMRVTSLIVADAWEAFKYCDSVANVIWMNYRVPPELLGAGNDTAMTAIAGPVPRGTANCVPLTRGCRAFGQPPGAPRDRRQRGRDVGRNNGEIPQSI